MTIQRCVLAAAVALATSSSVLAHDAVALKREMASLEQQIAQSGSAADVTALKTRYEAIAAQLRGAPAIGAIEGESLGLPNFLVASNYSTIGPCGSFDLGSAGSTLSFSSAPALGSPINRART